MKGGQLTDSKQHRHRSEQDQTAQLGLAFPRVEPLGLRLRSETRVSGYGEGGARGSRMQQPQPASTDEEQEPFQDPERTQVPEEMLFQVNPRTDM